VAFELLANYRMQRANRLPVCSARLEAGTPNDYDRAQALRRHTRPPDYPGRLARALSKLLAKNRFACGTTGRSSGIMDRFQPCQSRPATTPHPCWTGHPLKICKCTTAAEKPLAGSSTTRSNFQSNTNVQPFSAASGAMASYSMPSAPSRRPTATGGDIGPRPPQHYLSGASLGQ